MKIKLTRGPLHGREVDIDTLLHIKSGDTVYRYSLSPFAMYQGEDIPQTAPSVTFSDDHAYVGDSDPESLCIVCRRRKEYHVGKYSAEEGA